MQSRDNLSLIERLYFVEMIRGVSFTFGKLLRNFFVYLLNCVGLAKRKKPWVTIEYPDAIREYYPRYRGAHRLLLKDNATVSCTACFLCATACPAKCIYIEPEEGKGGVTPEKSPKRYEINTLQCTYCGLCVQACPVDAIRMDTGIHPEIYVPDPNAYIETKETLMQRSRDMRVGDTQGIRNQRLKKIKNIEKYPFSAGY